LHFSTEYRKNKLPITIKPPHQNTYNQDTLTVGTDAQIIELTQVNCQFVESENGTNHGFESTEKADCETTHEQSGEEQLATAVFIIPGEQMKNGEDRLVVLNKAALNVVRNQKKQSSHSCVHI